MKNFLLLFFIFSTIELHAQKVEYSISLGSNYSFFSMVQRDYKKNTNIYYGVEDSLGNIPPPYVYPNYEYKINSKGNLGFFINSNISVPLNNFFAVSIGLGLTTKNADITLIENEINYNIVNDEIVQGDIIITEDEKLDYKMIFIDLPLLMQFRLFKKKLRLSAGIKLSSVINAKENGETEDWNLKVKEKFEILNSFLLIGMEYKITKKIYLGIYYDRTMSLLFADILGNYPLRGLHTEAKLNSFSLNLSYKFKQNPPVSVN